MESRSDAIVIEGVVMAVDARKPRLFVDVIYMALRGMRQVASLRSSWWLPTWWGTG